MRKKIQIALLGDILAGNYLSDFLSGKNPNPITNHKETYIWGDLLPVLQEAALRLANLETVICKGSLKPWPGKKWCFRIDSDAAAAALRAAGIDYVSLGNNHTMDFGSAGLEQLLDTLKSQNISFSGAAMNESGAFIPAVLQSAVGKIGVYSFAFGDCHLCEQLDVNGKDLMGAAPDRPGICLLGEPTEEMIDMLCQRLLQDKEAFGLSFTICYMHWSGNYPNPRENPPIPWMPEEKYRQFSHQLIDKGGVHVLVGTSSHHTAGIEAHNGGLILYGTGDFLSDYYLDPPFYNVPEFFQFCPGHPAGKHPCAFMSFLYLLTLSEDGIEELKMIPVQGTKLQVQQVLPGHPYFLAHMNCAIISAKCLGTDLTENEGGLLTKLKSRFR